jgi:hypothetical protein
MNELVLTYSGGGYELLITNDPDPMGVIQFLLNSDDEAAPVRLLAQCMQQGPNAVAENAQYIFQGGDTVDLQWVQTVFSEVNSLVFSGDAVIPIYTATEGETLLDELADAGVRLAEFLAE